MKKIINDLIQLQELSAARDQQAAMPGARLEDLDLAIDAMLAQLPDDVGRQFLKLKKRSEISIVPVFNKGCAGCGMQLPVSFVQQVRQLEKLQYCPNCARILYYSDNLPTRVAQRHRRFETPKVGIARFSAESLMIGGLKATDQEEALRALCDTMAENGFIEQPDRILEEALKREAIASTAVDHGLAFPHVRGVEGGGLSMAVAVSKKGVKFGNPSGKLTRILFFMTIPTAASAFYLRLLSGLTQTFREKDNRDKLLQAKDEAEIWKVLTKLTRTTIK